MRYRVIEIDNPCDPRINDYRAIRDRDMLGEAGRPGLFVGEQFLTVCKMLAQPGMTKSILVTPNWRERIEREAQHAPDPQPCCRRLVHNRDEDHGDFLPIYQIPKSMMQQVAGFPIHRGVLAIGYRPDPAKMSVDHLLDQLNDRCTVLLCEAIANIDNIGGLFRNAAAFGVDAVVLSPRCHDPLYRKSIRVSIGHVLTMPWARSEDWHGDIERIRAHWGITIIGAATGQRAQPVDAIDRPARVGLLLGPEYEGLPEDTLARCDHVARIPMAPGVDSLNVAVASAVLLHRFSQGLRT